MPDRKRTINFSEDDPNSAPAKGHRYLLAIGIDQYEHYPRLYNAVRDAQDFVALMQEKYGFSGEQATVVTLFDEQATGDNIQAQLENLADRVTENDSCLLYFSGHGTYHKTLDEGYWIPVDAKKGERRSYLQNTVVQKILAAIKSHHTFLIADSCFSGSMFVGTPVRDAADSLEREPSRWGLTSGRNEVVADGQPGENSPFAQTLLDLLRRSEQPLGVASLCAKMMEIVTANAQQTPRGEPLAIRGHRGGQYIFRPTDTAALQADADWARAERLHTEAAYDHFVEQHPRDTRAALAEQRMAELADDRKWQETDAKGGLLDYNAYLRAYPQGRHAEKARNKITALREPEPQPAPPEPRLVPQTLKVEPQKIKPPISAPKANPPAPSFVPQPKAPSNADLTTFQKLSNFWAQNQWLATGIFVLFLFSCWLVWGILHKQPDLAKENHKTSLVSTPPATATPGGFVLVKGGTFQMGSPTNEKGRGDEEVQHAVTVKDFYMGKYEVTQSEWVKVMGNNPSRFNNCDQCPVENVSWNDVRAYIKKLNVQTGKKYRLPTEAEWEYAAREGGKNVRFGNGKYIADPAEMNFDAKTYGDYVYAKKGTYRAKTTPVGSFQPNALGLYDMSGNVWEWCSDWYGDYRTTTQTNPTGPEKGTYRVIRGGSWFLEAKLCRVSSRTGDTPLNRSDYLGFRLASSSQ